MKSPLYLAARHGAAVLKQPWNAGILQLTGPDRISWLQGMVSNDVEKVHPGNGTYAAHLNAQGKLIAPMKILIDPEIVWLTMEASIAKNVAAVLDRMIVMEDAAIQDQSGSYECIGVPGPAAAAVLEAWLGEPLNLSSEYQHRAFAKCPRILRDELGYVVWVRAGDADSIITEIQASGATVIDQATWNVIRTEAGLPIYGIDIDDTTTLPELGGKGISYDKGCYIGQEVVARIKYIGHVNRRFMGFACDGDALPDPRSVIRTFDKESGKENGREAGYITSSVISPQMGVIALGFVLRAVAVAGTKVELRTSAGSIPATVVELPFMPSATWPLG